MRPPETTRLPCRQVARQKASSDHLHESKPVEVVDPAGAPAGHRSTPTAQPEHGRCAGDVSRHPRGQVPRQPRASSPAGRGSPALPPLEALRPLARALVALAMEVRTDGLAPGQEKRSHLPTGKGGRPCAA